MIQVSASGKTRSASVIAEDAMYVHAIDGTMHVDMCNVLYVLVVCVHACMRACGLQYTGNHIQSEHDQHTITTAQKALANVF